MKIGIIMHPYGEKQPGGLPRIIFGWTHALLSVDRINEYIIFFKEQPKVLPELPGANWKIEVLGKGRFWLDRLKSHSKADVYLFNTPVLPLFWKPTASVLIALDYPYKYLKPRNLWDRLRRIFISWYHGRSLQKADHIVAVSNSTKRDTVRFFNVPEEKITVVYHGFKKICELPQSEVVLPPQFFFFAGTLKERKNVLNIVKGYQKFIQDNPKSQHFLVIGGKNEGVYFEKLLCFIHQEKLIEKVIFLGHLNENQLSYVYRRAEALVFPSIVEGTGFPILEAMSCGIPVITSNIFGPAELGGNGAAHLVDPYKFEAIAEGMQKITTDPEYRNSLIEQGHKNLLKFSWESCGRETLAILEKTANI